MDIKELKLEINALKKEILSLKMESSLFYDMLEGVCEELEKCDKEKHHKTLLAYRNALSEFKRQRYDYYDSSKLEKEYNDIINDCDV